MGMNAVANRGKLVDAECYLHGTPGTPVSRGGRGATGVTATSYGRASNTGAAIIFDTGGGFTEGVVVIDLATASTLSTHAFYTIHLQMSDGAAMATPVFSRPLLTVGQNQPAVTVNFGAPRNTRIVSNYGNNRTRFVIPITNDFGGTCLRYLRLCHEIRKVTAASVDLGLQYSAFISVMP